ncbi:MAG: 7TM diverse intracellular signaling domain-containing protein [Spirochaetota bacterium]
MQAVAVSVQPRQASQEITNSVSFYLEDKAQAISAEQILAMPAEEFSSFAKKNSSSFGVKGLSLWLRIALHNPNQQSLVRYLEIAHPHLDFVSLYQKKNKQLKLLAKSGKYLPIYKRQIKYKNPVFPIQLVAKNTQTYYIHISSSGAINIPLLLWQSNRFYDYIGTTNYLYGFYFGIMVVMALYNLFIFFSTKESAYLYYIFYILCFAFMQIAKNGLLGLLTRDAVELERHSVPLLIAGSIIFSILFSRKFLNTKQNSKTFDKVLLGLSLITFTILPITLLYPIHIGLQLGLLCAGIWSIVMLFLSLFFLYLGYRLARFFFLAWAVLILSVFTSALHVAGLLPDSFFTLHCMEIGSALEVILLSLALADRINLLKKEKEEAQKRSLQRQIILTESYARFVPQELLTLLSRKEITDIHLGDAIEKEMTVLFSDIRSFTSISETMSPEENFQFLNGILKLIGPIIRKHNGFIDKYIGDAIMGLFPYSPQDAVKASIEICHAIDALNHSRAEENKVPIQIGIGINTGNVILGTIGESKRMEGTVISDTVNLSSRLEGLTKRYESRVILGERTVEELSKIHVFSLRYLDWVKVKGKNQAIRIYDLLDAENSAKRQDKLAILPQLQEAITDYLAKNFSSAKSKLLQILNTIPTETLAKLYLQKIEAIEGHDLPEDWDGSTQLFSK